MDSTTYAFRCPHRSQQISGTPAPTRPSCRQPFTVPGRSRRASTSGNALVVPLIIVTVLLIAALVAATYLWVEGVPSAAPAKEATATPQGTSTAASGFEAVAGHLDSGGSLFVYADSSQYLTGLSKQFNAFVDFMNSVTPKKDPETEASAKIGFAIVSELLKQSGVEQISAVGASTANSTEPGIYVSKVFLRKAESAEDGLLWTAFGRSPHHFDAIDFLPANTALANSSDLDLSHLLEGLRSEIHRLELPNGTQALDVSLKQFSTSFGISLEDVLQSLDGSISLIVTLDEANPVTTPAGTFPRPRVALLLRVKDERIFAQIDHTLGANPQVSKHDEAELRTRVIPMPGPMQDWLRPTIAQWSQGYLVLATDDSIINDIVAAQKSGKGYKSTPQFASMTSGLPQEGNSFQLVTQQFQETAIKLQQQMLKNQPNTTPDQTAIMQKLFGGQQPGHFCSVSTRLPDGWLIVGRGTQGAGQLIATKVVVPAALLAGIAAPVFTAGQQKAKATKSLSNAKQIAVACKLYAIEHQGQYPPSLPALVPKYLPNTSADTIFHSPFKPEDPLGYNYQPGLTDTSAANLVLVEDKYAPTMARQRIVALADASARIIPLAPPSTH